MKVIVNRKEFIQALSLGSSFSGKNKALMALDYTRLVFKGNTCRITSNDGEMAITTSYAMESYIDDDSEFYVDAKTLIKALNSLKEENVAIEFDNGACIINHKKGVFNIPQGDVDVYPIPSMDKDTTIAKVSSEMLFNWMKEARQFTAEDELRPVMNGVYIYIENNRIGVCASDGHRMYTDDMEFFSDSNMSAILSSKAISTLLETINGSEETTIYFGERNVAFKAKNTSIMCRKIDGRYPNFKAVIPTTNKFVVDCNKSELQESLSRCLLMANANALIKLMMNKGLMQLIAEDLDFSRKGEEFVDFASTTHDGEKFEIGFKGTFAKVCLDCVESVNVRLEMTDASRPIVMKDNCNENKVIILMPCML